MRVGTEVSENRFEFSCGSQSRDESFVIARKISHGIDEELDLVFRRLVHAARPAFQEFFERYHCQVAVERCLECGCVRSRRPRKADGRNHKTRQNPTDSPAKKLPCARILKRWGVKREDASRLRSRRGSASVRWWLFPASQPLRPCQLHHFNFAGIDRNLSKISLISSAVRSLPFAAFNVAAVAWAISSLT